MCVGGRGSTVMPVEGRCGGGGGELHGTEESQGKKVITVSAGLGTAVFSS